MANEKPLPLLVLYRGILAGSRWVLDAERTLIGRAPDCTIVLPERQISRYHVAIESDQEGYLLRDLASKNGTLVNGQPVRDQPYRLKDGDDIVLASIVHFSFTLGDATLPLEDLEAERAETAQACLTLDPALRSVRLGREVLDPPLSMQQYRLLELLMQRSGRAVSREEVLDHVWPEASGLGITPQALDALVYRVRERLAELDPDHNYIVTVRGFGYRFEPRP